MKDKMDWYIGLIVMDNVVLHEESGDSCMLTFNNGSTVTFECEVRELDGNTYGVYQYFEDGSFSLISVFED